MMRTITKQGTNNHLIIMLHGTGGSADSLFSIGEIIDPMATYIGIEGEVLENGMRRYFERYADGSFKLKSLAEATSKLFKTINKIILENPDKTITLVGYSNGANIALNLLKEYEKLNINNALLYHPSVVRPEIAYQKQNDLNILITSGHNDPFIDQKDFEILAEDLKQIANTKTYTHEYGHQLIQEELDVSIQFLGGHGHENS